MAGVRHGFFSTDGRSVPEWQGVSRRAEFLVGPGAGRDVATRFDLCWIHASASDPSRSYLEWIRQMSGDTPCVVLADVPDDLAALEAFSAGARGYCNSRANPRVLKLVSDVVLQGGLWVGESLLRRIVTGVQRVAPSSQPNQKTIDSINALTPRERQVAEAVADGDSNKDVARRLSITERTVKAHLSTIFDKLGVKDRLQLSLKIISLRKAGPA
jgi:DNA-binding NarL/FixJ family response regulator